MLNLKNQFIMKNLLNILVFIPTLLITSDLLAQWPPTPPANTPLDSGLLLLIGASVGLGVKKLNDKAKKRKSE